MLATLQNGRKVFLLRNKKNMSPFSNVTLITIQKDCRCSVCPLLFVKKNYSLFYNFIIYSSVAGGPHDS